MIAGMSDTTATGSPEIPDRHRQASTVSVAEAAHALGISHDALRSRLRRGTLDGFKDGDEWRVVLPADRQATGDVPPQQAATGNETGSPTGNDLSPLVDLIERQAAELQRLAASSAMWQARATHLEDQLRQLAPGTIAPESPPESSLMAPGSTETNESPPSGIWTWVKRLLGG
jgi:hypothetical protein